MESEGRWMSVDETAAYLRMGKTALYTLAREGRIPVRKIGKKWVFEKGGLDAWVRTNQPLESLLPQSGFQYRRERLSARTATRWLSPDL